MEDVKLSLGQDGETTRVTGGEWKKSLGVEN